MSDRPNLRHVLEELAERLEEEAGYEPASITSDMTDSDICDLWANDTLLIHQLSVWLGDPDSPERRVALKEMGFNWSEE